MEDQGVLEQRLLKAAGVPLTTWGETTPPDG
jgi:hypothetical protein